jgi:Mg-chelatase subunit ChlD
MPTNLRLSHRLRMFLIRGMLIGGTAGKGRRSAKRLRRAAWIPPSISLPAIMEGGVRALAPSGSAAVISNATMRAAAPFQQERSEQRKRVAFAIRPSDFQRKVRVKKTANLVLFVVDASWSMAVAERMSATKGAILSLLTDAYQRRDRVGLVVFQKDRATLVLPPTNSVQLAERALADIPVGGKTPLSAGLLLTHEVLTREHTLHPDVVPLVILLTDGAGNVSMTSLPPQEEAHRLANKIAEDNIHCVVINMEHAAFDQGLAQALAEHLKAPCYALNEIKAETLYHTVREEMDANRSL